MFPAAEGQMVRGAAGDVEALRVRVVALVAVRRAVEQGHAAARGQRYAVDLVVLGQDPAELGDRGLQAQ